MDALWTRGASSVREVQESFPAERQPAYTTVQTMMSRLERKGAVRKVRKIGNAFLFEAVVPRDSARRRIVDDLLGFFGGRTELLISHLIETRQLSMKDLQEAEKALRRQPGAGSKK
jgi:predicted transcriptional regulator